jgi:hypothetical protein
MNSNSVPIAISLHPAFISHLNIPNVMLVPIWFIKRSARSTIKW